MLAPWPGEHPDPDVPVVEVLHQVDEMAEIAAEAIEPPDDDHVSLPRRLEEGGEPPGDDLIRAFTLTGADRDLVAIRRGAANRLGLALQLCALRYLGFVPRNLSAAPRSAACFVADQLAYRTRPSLSGKRKPAFSISESKAGGRTKAI